MVTLVSGRSIVAVGATRVEDITRTLSMQSHHYVPNEMVEQPHVYVAPLPPCIVCAFSNTLIEHEACL